MKTIVPVLLVLGLGVIVTGVAFIYWPAAIILAGVFLVALASMIDLDVSPKAEGVDVVDETEEHVATIARVRG